MEVRALRTILAVARTRSFGAAALELGYTQSAVSQQVAALERELGAALFDRRPVRLTAAGERLVEHAARIVLRVDAARSELAGLDRSARELRIAASPLAARGLLAPALRELRATAPGLVVSIRGLGRAEALEVVARGEVDVALVDGIVEPEAPLALSDAGLLDASVVRIAPVAVALPRRHPLARRDGIDLDTVADAPFIVAPRLAADAENRLSPRGTRLTYAGDDVTTLLELVAAGHGLTMLPASACASDETVGLVLRAPPLVHRVEILRLRGALPVVERLASHLRARAELAR